MLTIDREEPDDHLGNWDDLWAGLWIEEAGDVDRRWAGIIIVKQPDKSLDLFVYATNDEVREAWIQMEQTIEGVTPSD